MSYDRRLDGLRSDGSKGHVLVVDDAAFAAKHLSQMLTGDGYVVVGVAEDGEKAVEMYKEKYPDIDLVTLDVTMPKLDGITTLEQILTFDKDAHVIMITASSNETIVKRAIMLGAKNFIVKPLQYQLAIPRIESSTRK